MLGIVVSANPSKARDLLAYLATLLAGAEKEIGGEGRLVESV